MPDPTAQAEAGSGTTSVSYDPERVRCMEEHLPCPCLAVKLAAAREEAAWERDLARRALARVTSVRRANEERDAARGEALRMDAQHQQARTAWMEALNAATARVAVLETAVQALLDAAQGWGGVTEREEDFVVESYDIPASLIVALDAALAATSARARVGATQVDVD